MAVPFFSRLQDSKLGLEIIETVMMDLIANIKGGQSPNGCLLCNTIAELGSSADERVHRVLETYLEKKEAYFHAALLRARELGEIPESADARGQAKMLVGYSTGLLGMAKVLGEDAMRRSVESTVAALR